MRRKAKMSTKVPCTKCRGFGTYELTGNYRETLELLRKQRRELNGKELAQIAKIEPTAMNNRLVWLENAGLAHGRRYGKERLWRAV